MKFSDILSAVKENLFAADLDQLAVVVSDLLAEKRTADEEAEDYSGRTKLTNTMSSP